MILCRKIIALLALAILPMLLIGCATSIHTRIDVKYRMAGVEKGDSVFVVSINGSQFEHRSSNGGIEFFKSGNSTVLKVRVWSGRGTYFGGEVDYYYFIDSNGHVVLLGNLNESWYENEDFVRVKMSGFHPIRVPESSE